MGGSTPKSNDSEPSTRHRQRMRGVNPPKPLVASKNIMIVPHRRFSGAALALAVFERRSIIPNHLSETPSERMKQKKRRMIWNIGMREIFISNYIIIYTLSRSKGVGMSWNSLEWQA